MFGNINPIGFWWFMMVYVMAYDGLSWLVYCDIEFSHIWLQLGCLVVSRFLLGVHPTEGTQVSTVKPPNKSLRTCKHTILYDTICNHIKGSCPGATDPPLRVIWAELMIPPDKPYI